MKIPCTIGMLSYNSQKNIGRALNSIADFAEIIIADGGSTDDTRSIAIAHGARIISQSNPGHPITDFALERNRTLEAATQPWFFYLDSDEIMSPELVEHIRQAASDPQNPCGVYRVRYCKTDAEGKKLYRTFKEYYQTRLFRTDIGARFIRPVHERIEFPVGTAIGTTEAPWYVLLEEEDLSLHASSKKIWRRIGIQAAEWKSNGAPHPFERIFITPLVLFGKSLMKLILVHVRYGNNAIPVRYELIRMISAIFTSLQHIRALFRTTHG